MAFSESPAGNRARSNEQAHRVNTHGPCISASPQKGKPLLRVRYSHNRVFRKPGAVHSAEFLVGRKKSTAERVRLVASVSGLRVYGLGWRGRIVDCVHLGLLVVGKVRRIVLPVITGKGASAPARVKGEGLPLEVSLKRNGGEQLILTLPSAAPLGSFSGRVHIFGSSEAPVVVPVNRNCDRLLSSCGSLRHGGCFRSGCREGRVRISRRPWEGPGRASS